MSVRRLLSGLFLGVCLVLAAWGTGIVQPPETLSRRIAAWSAVYPGPVGEAEITPISCPPLRRTRLYLVCTRGCSVVRRLVALSGLGATPLANLNRTPPEELTVTRGRINGVIASEKLNLDADQAREMIGCFMRIEGLEPALVLPENGLEDVVSARAAGDEAMQRLASGMNEAGALARLRMEEVPGGYTTSFLYWHVTRPGVPVLRVWIEMTRGGVLRAMRAIQVDPLAPPAGAAGDLGPMAPAPPGPTSPAPVPPPGGTPAPGPA